MDAASQISELAGLENRRLNPEGQVPHEITDNIASQQVQAHNLDDALSQQSGTAQQSAAAGPMLVNTGSDFEPNVPLAAGKDGGVVPPSPDRIAQAVALTGFKGPLTPKMQEILLGTLDRKEQADAAAAAEAHAFQADPHGYMAQQGAKLDDWVHNYAKTLQSPDHPLWAPSGSNTPPPKPGESIMPSSGGNKAGGKGASRATSPSHTDYGNEDSAVRASAAKHKAEEAPKPNIPKSSIAKAATGGSEAALLRPMPAPDTPSAEFVKSSTRKMPVAPTPGVVDFSNAAPLAAPDYAGSGLNAVQGAAAIPAAARSKPALNPNTGTLDFAGYDNVTQPFQKPGQKKPPAQNADKLKKSSDKGKAQITF